MVSRGVARCGRPHRFFLAIGRRGSGQFNRETATTSTPLTLPGDIALLESSVVGSDISDWVSLRTSAAQLTLGFTDLIPSDGPGADLAIVEIGATANVSVTIAGITHSYISQPSGDVNMIRVDLSLFGVTSAPAITISSSNIFNDIAAAAAINAVPEPATFSLAALEAILLVASAAKVKTVRQNPLLTRSNVLQ